MNPLAAIAAIVERRLNIRGHWRKLLIIIIESIMPAWYCIVFLMLRMTTFVTRRFGRQLVTPAENFVLARALPIMKKTAGMIT
jgi:hypothetical protein